MIALIAALQIAAAPRSVEVGPEEFVAVHEAGDPYGPTVVFVPGLVGSAFGYRNIAAQLTSNGYRVLVVDPLGTGSSAQPEYADYSATAQAARIASAASLEGVRSAVFVCHAMGATICYRLAFSYPHLVRGIVAINGPAVERLATPGLGLALKLRPLIDLFGGEGFVRGKLRGGLKDSSHDPSWVTDAVVDGYTAHYQDGLGPVLRSLRRIADATEPDSLVPALPTLQTPVHLLVGDGDRGLSMRPEEIETLRVLPQLNVDTVANAGLYIHEEQPDAVVRAIMQMDGRLVNAEGR